MVDIWSKGYFSNLIAASSKWNISSKTHKDNFEAIFMPFSSVYRCLCSLYGCWQHRSNLCSKIYVDNIGIHVSTYVVNIGIYVANIGIENLGESKYCRLFFSVSGGKTVLVGSEWMAQLFLQALILLGKGALFAKTKLKEHQTWSKCSLQKWKTAL